MTAGVPDDRALLFTVVIPLFNKSAHIQATLASVAAQTHDAFEVIVVDDGSTDGSDALVEAWDDSRLRLVRQANGGPGLARNRGVDEARGAWVAFIDADDLWLPDHLATLAEAMTACPAADVAAAGYVRGHTVQAISEQDRGPPRVVDFLAEHDRFWTSAVAIRTALLRHERFGMVWPGEDVELWTRLALRHVFALHSRRTAVYVQLTGGAMDSQSGAGAAVPIQQQPLFNTIESALSDHNLADRHDALERFRNALLLEYVRPALFTGQVVMAREYLSALSGHGVRAPLQYRVLACLPGSLLARLARLYSSVKRRVAAYD